MIMEKWLIEKSANLDWPTVLVLLFMTITLFGCGESGPYASSQTGLPASLSESADSHEWPTKTDRDLLKSTDKFDVRMAISSISGAKNGDVTSHLIDLWNGRGVLFKEINKEALEHPVVRLTLAQSIVQNGVTDSKYYDYIKRYVYSDDAVVRMIATEALRDIYSEEALYLLREIADSEDKKIAEIAISGIKHQTVYGENRDVASSLWKDLGDSDTRYKDIITKYNKMYNDYLRERRRRIQEGFVPTEKKRGR